jgi:hypothetical protein
MSLDVTEAFSRIELAEPIVASAVRDILAAIADGLPLDLSGDALLQYALASARTPGRMLKMPAAASRRPSRRRVFRLTI